MGLFSSKQNRELPQPPIVPTDTIFPLRFADRLYPFAFDFPLVFRQVLDPEILRASAESVLQREGWRQLGARLRRNVRRGSVFVLVRKKNYVTYIITDYSKTEKWQA